MLGSDTVLVEAVAHEWDIFHFQRGTDAGLCLHALLEETDFQQSAHAQIDTYLPILERHQIDASWYPALYDMIDATRLAQLDEGVCLAQLPPEKRLAEMGFVMSVSAFEAENIKQWLLESNLPQSIKDSARGLHFKDVLGFLNGFIDLVCVSLQGQVYVIDYKSNHLGHLPKHYQDHALNQAINDHHYYLQALIYALAVARYLRHRQFAFDGIKVRYLFLRGLKATDKQGVWHWDISGEQLDKIDASLAS